MIRLPAPAQRPSPVKVSRMVYGANDEAGQFVTSIANSQAHTGLAVKYFDWIPWYLRVYLHTIKVSINGTLGNLSHFSSSLLYSLLLLIRRFFSAVNNTFQTLQPSVSRDQPTVIELGFILPPQTTVTVSFDFEKAFLKIDEHLPDANRGFDIRFVFFTQTFAFTCPSPSLPPPTPTLFLFSLLVGPSFPSPQR